MYRTTARVQEDRRDRPRNATATSSRRGRHPRQRSAAAMPARPLYPWSQQQGCQAAWLSGTRAQFAATFSSADRWRFVRAMRLQGKAGRGWLRRLYVSQSVSMQARRRDPEPYTALLIGMGSSDSCQFQGMDKSQWANVRGRSRESGKKALLYPRIDVNRRLHACRVLLLQHSHDSFGKSDP